MNRRTACLAALAGLVLSVALSPAALAGVVTVKNTNGKYPITLSDLIVWDKEGKQQVIKKPGFDKDGSADDEEIPFPGERVYVTDFDVAKYFCSIKVGDLEYETKNNLTVSTVSSLNQMIDPQSQNALHMELLDGQYALAEAPVGAFYHFENGLSEQFPGWFVGTDVDFVGGEILNGFTGVAQVVGSGGHVEVTPTPGTAALLLGGAGALARRKR